MWNEGGNPRLKVCFLLMWGNILDFPLVDYFLDKSYFRSFMGIEDGGGGGVEWLNGKKLSGSNLCSKIDSTIFCEF